MEFTDFKIKKDILKGIYGYGLLKPSEIQELAIPNILEGKDVIAQAKSGTGKTIAFVIGLLEQINTNENNIQGIIIAHTRELAMQISNVIYEISKNIKGIKISLCIGGTNVGKNIDETTKANILIGTIGRLFDLIVEKQCIDMSNLKIMVLDEADELLNETKKNEIHHIHDIMIMMPTKTQVCLFSATIPKKLLDLTSKFMHNPTKILLEDASLSVEGIRQYYINIQHEKYKFETLKDIYGRISIAQCIIYVNSKEKAEFLKNELLKEQYSISMIHGDMEQISRIEIMKDFRSGKNRILISTDLLARGIDVQQVNVIINYDVPYEIDCYLHRVGRSGRYGRVGLSITFVTDKDKRQLKEIEKKFMIQIEELPENINNII